MTRKQIEEKFQAHEQHLRKLAWQCQSRNGFRTHEECYQEACGLFMEACSSYREECGAFASWVGLCVWQGLVRWSRKNVSPPDPETIPESAYTAPVWERPDKALMFKDWLAQLTDECKEVVEIILNGPAEILGMEDGGSFAGAIGSLKKHLRSKGWSNPKIWETMKEMRMEVQSL